MFCVRNCVAEYLLAQEKSFMLRQAQHERGVESGLVTRFKVSPHHPHAPGCRLGDDDVAVDACFGRGLGHFVADGHFAAG